MNKLIITGNGFDLAHKLPTSYADFINWFWNNICKNYDNDLFSNLYYFNPEFKSRFEHIDSLKNSSEIINKIKKGAEFVDQVRENFNNSYLLEVNREVFCKYNNSFFKFINTTLESNKNWVDIEMCYYKLLIDDRFRSSRKIYTVSELNNQFEQVKQLFEYYLKKVVLVESVEMNFEIRDLLKPIFNEGVCKTSFYKNYLAEFHTKYSDELSEDNELLINGKSSQENQVRLPKALFLDFNYTETIKLYFESIERNDDLFSRVDIIKIHGEIDDKFNPINFGFGDEMDSQYKVLENYNDNEYLKNIKSFHYFYNQNYRDLMNWIELGNYQIIIMGHSCGLSDRTLLNTLFEHENCASIKFFYYENGKGDNYTDIVQNISRHFDDKKVMRNKIVNKSLTKPLPQK